MTEHHLIRLTLDDGSTLEPMVYAQDPDAIYAAWLDGGGEF